MEMGPFKQSSDEKDKIKHGAGPLGMDVLGRISFEEHCDKFLLGSDRSNQNQNDIQVIKKQATETQKEPKLGAALNHIVSRTRNNNLLDDDEDVIVEGVDGNEDLENVDGDIIRVGGSNNRSNIQRRMNSN